MKTLILHVGYPKSGSSALQVALRTHADTLAAHGVDYPLLDTREIDAIKKRGFGSGNAIFLVEALKMGKKLSHLLRQVEACKGTHVILATESFGQVTHEQVAPLSDWMRGLGWEVRLLAYHRSPFDLNLSGYSQAVKRGRMVKPLTAAAGAFKDPQQRIRDVFAGWTIEERPYQQHRSDLLNDLLGWIVPDAPRLDFPQKSTNRSISQEEAVVIKRLNASNMDKSDIDAIVSSILKEEMYGKPLAHNVQSVKALCQTLSLNPEAHMHHVTRHDQISNTNIMQVALRVTELMADLLSTRPPRSGVNA